MRTALFALLAPVALASQYAAPSSSHTTVVSTYTATRTVMRVMTETMTGHPNGTHPTGYSWPSNSTSSAPTGAKVSPSAPQQYSPGASNAASQGSVNIALAALAAAGVYVVL